MTILATLHALDPPSWRRPLDGDYSNSWSRPRGSERETPETSSRSGTASTASATALPVQPVTPATQTRITSWAGVDSCERPTRAD
jgi:hypothetical protein